MSETVSGPVERVTYHNPETGFAVLRVKVKGHADLVTVVGTATAVTAGEHLEASGQWIVDPNHGRQFKADSLKTSHPASAAGIERYLASGAIRSVGPKLAAKIVAHYKERTLEVLDKSPDFLLHIRGIGAERLKRIRQSWEEQKEVRRILVFLADCGVSPARAVRIYRTYGTEAIARIKANPYCLADDIRGIGFKTADELAGRLGIDRNSPYRARAAVRYALQTLSSEGHCAYPEAEAIEKTTALVEIDSQIVQSAVDAGTREGWLVREAMEEGPWIYLAPLYRAEVGLAQALGKLLAQGGHPFGAIDVEKALAWVEGRLELRLADGQREAVRRACQEKVLVITGGPGVGKTTLVRSILEIFAARRLKCVLAAPTGRAAKRLAETTGREAKTLHRLLQFDPATGEFQRNEHFPLDGDLFVFDETSMVDVVLGHQMLRALPPHACVVLVGDVDQLPSVGPGSVLADLIASRGARRAPDRNLSPGAESRIVAAAYAINGGRLPDLTATDELGDFYFVEADEPETIQDRLLRLVQERIPARFGLDARTDIQVLAPMNRSPLGARNLNLVLQAALNPPGHAAEIERFGWTFRVGDRVIQTENDYSRDVFNGDLGIVESINRIEQQLVVNFEGRPVPYDFADLDELSLAYVLSIHKSQGSEYPCVVIPLHTQHYMMLRRNLLYTAVTRARRLAVLVGSRKALGMAVRRQETGRRYTALRRRIQEHRRRTTDR